MQELVFESKGSTVVEPRYGISISEPRLAPTDVPGEIEYQYPITVNGAAGGLGFFGTQRNLTGAGQRTSSSTLVLEPESVLSSILALKGRVGFDGDDYSFLAGFSKGLIQVFEYASSLLTDYHYAVVVGESSLIGLGMQVPGGVRDDQGRVVLADLLVRHRSEQASGATL